MLPLTSFETLGKSACLHFYIWKWGYNAILTLTTCSFAKLHRLRAQASTRQLSLQTPTISSRVPRPATPLTNWLQIWEFPLIALIICWHNLQNSRKYYTLNSCSKRIQLRNSEKMKYIKGIFWEGSKCKTPMSSPCRVRTHPWTHSIFSVQSFH